MMRHRLALALVFWASAAVLVVEITAGRLLAPYVGVSLETFTGIIGTVLAGIATGAAVGGRLADRRDPTSLIGPALLAGGALTWVAVPVVQALGPQFPGGGPAIIVLAATGFFLPAAVLSAVSPMVAKARLGSLSETGAVVGGLSAAGTAGAILGTFVTGFVLVATMSSRMIMFATGGLLVATGLGLQLWLRRRPGLATVALLVAAGLSTFGLSSPCDRETTYACAIVVVDDHRPSGRSLYLDSVRNAHVDLDDPTHLELRYVRLFADVMAGLPDGPIDVLHIGGGGFTFAQHVAAVRPGSHNHVLEIDPGVVELAVDELGLVLSDELTVEVGDARRALPDLASGGYDLVVGDAFSGMAVPWHLTTVEVAGQIDRLLRPGGMYVMNVIDGDPNRFARAELATLAERFDHVAVILPDGRPPRQSRNQILVASDRPLPDLDIDRADGVLVDGAALDDYIGAARILTDDFAPVDQLVNR